MRSPDVPPARRRWVLDVVLVVVVLGYDLLVQGVPAGGGWSFGLLLPLGLCLPHLLHRRWPLGAYAATLAFAFVQLGLGMGPLVADVMIAVSLASLTVRRPPRVSLVAASCALGWVALLGALQLGGDGFDLGELAAAGLLMVVAWSAGQLRRTRAQRLTALRERAEHLERERESELRLAAGEERTRIARELHDIVSHSLSAVTLLADGAAASVDTDPAAARTAMLRVRDTSREAMTQMRSMLSVLRTDDDHGLAPAPRLADVDTLVAEARHAGTPVRVASGEVDEAGVPAQVQAVAYRIVQEGLTNVRRHAPSASRVEVEIARADDELRVGVRDDGHDPVTPEPGHGLRGMSERVAALGGTLHTGRRHDGGFEVLARLPTDQEER